MKAETKRQKYEVLRSQLENERTSFLSHWRDLGDYILPRRPRFAITDVNKGDRRNQKIIDSTATISARTLRSGMMSGVTSPARPWFRLTTPDPELSEIGPVKQWLHDVSQRMNTVFLRSNLYNVLPTIYGDLGVFATGAMSMEEDFTEVIRFYPFPVGSYMIAQDHKLRVNTFFREFRMTVRQLVDRFGRMDEMAILNEQAEAMNKPQQPEPEKKSKKDKAPEPAPVMQEQKPKKENIDWSKFSDYIKQAYERGEYETWIDVCHLIKPNEDYDPNKIESKYKKFLSCYYERGTQGTQNYITNADNDRYLSEKGYDYFPILCPRWETTGEDVYGTNCPGMEAIGDIKQLQLGEKRVAQAIEKMINPPMTGPTSLRNQKASILPGDITYVDVREGQQGFRSAHEINPRINEMEQKQEQVRQRVKRCFYEDLFLMLANSDRRQITAREIEERHEEKLLALGPVLEQLNQDLLDPLIDNTFDIMLRQELIPAPPKELEGMKLKVEYLSIMAQSQKIIGIGGIERFIGFVGQIAQSDPGVLDKVNGDQVIDVYGDMTSVPPGIIRTDEEVAEMRDSRAKAQANQQQMEAVAQGAKAAKDLSQADVSGENVLTRMIKKGEEQGGNQEEAG